MKTRSVSRQGAAAAQSEHYRAFATIDAAGHVAPPGFADGRAHAVDAPLGQKAALRDGVATTRDQEVGAYPFEL